MKPTDYLLEQHYQNAAARPQRKYEETLTSFDRNIFWYDRDEVSRQVVNITDAPPKKITYEDHYKAITIATNMLRKDTVHDIAMTILTHRFFADYRNNAFAGMGSFTQDYSFIVKKAGMLLNIATGAVIATNIPAKLREYTKPTLVQINHIAGIVKPIRVPDTGETLNEWAVKMNAGAPESTSYMVAGLNLGNA